ncbi:MAG: AAA family ATPase [Steroidobacteraceae bacterium]
MTNLTLQTLGITDHATGSVNAVHDSIRQLNQVILGKEQQVRLALTCLLARGHLLIEDLPGMGKTTLAHALAHTLGLSYQRIQFTSDLLPADIIGVSIFDRNNSSFHFHKGPIFAQLVLADEVNRATPKAQSALLEAMEEQQVTTDGHTYPLSAPFFVIATQNPMYQIGTYPLPESQLDRFLMRLELGYPDATHERQLLSGRDRRDLLGTFPIMLTPAQLLSLQNRVPQVHVSGALLDYLQAIIHYTRHCNKFVAGLSPRAGLALMHAAQAWALMHGHAGVLPEDVQAVMTAVIGHRLVATEAAGFTTPTEIGAHVLQAVAVP